MILLTTINRQSAQFCYFWSGWWKIWLAGAVLALTTLISSGAPVSAAPQPLATDAKAQIVTTNSSLIMASSPTGSNLTVDRVGRTISGYAWSTDLGWVNFSAGLAVGSGGLIHGLTPSADGAAVLDFNSTPHNANVIINANNHLEGYAWSKDIGWIHFDGAGNAKSLTTNAPLDVNARPMRANVTIDDLTGQMAGYAWNRDLGWLDFAGVKVESDGRVTGQAVVKNSNNKLHFNTSPYNANVQVAQNGQFSGYAWNDDLGWVAFSGVQTADSTFPIKTVPGQVRNFTIVPIPSNTPGKGAVRLTWQEPESDGNSPIVSYLVESCKSNISGDCNPGVNFSEHNAGLPASYRSFDIHNLDNGSTDNYTFRIKARNIVGDGPYSDVVTVRASYITLQTVNNQVQLSVTPTSNSSFSSLSHNIKVDSNLPSGVDLRLSVATAHNHLTGSAGQTIAPTNGSFNNPQAIANDSWGYRINGGAFGLNTAIETNVANSNFTWAQVPPSNNPDVIFTSTGVVDQTIPVYYGVKVSNSKPSGAYSGTVIYEAIGR